jgi:hypothetical protein
VTSLRTVTDAVSELGKDAKESVEEFGRKMNDARSETAEALHTAASTPLHFSSTCRTVLLRAPLRCQQA